MKEKIWAFLKKHVTVEWQKSQMQSQVAVRQWQKHTEFHNQISLGMFEYEWNSLNKEKFKLFSAPKTLGIKTNSTSIPERKMYKEVKVRIYPVGVIGQNNLMVHPERVWWSLGKFNFKFIKSPCLTGLIRENKGGSVSFTIYCP